MLFPRRTTGLGLVQKIKVGGGTPGKGFHSNDQRRPAPFAPSYMVGPEDKRTNNRTMLPTLKNNAAAGYQGPVKIELLKGAGL